MSNSIFDFNVHLPHLQDADVNMVIANDMNLDQDGLIQGLKVREKIIKELVGVNFLLFNTKLFFNDISLFKKEANQVCNHVSLTALIDFRSDDIKRYLQAVANQGGTFVMVNSYLQCIGKHDYSKVIEAFSFAASLGLSICIDGSYGTSRMFAYDNIELACEVADQITEVPIVIIHSGGLRVLNAMLLALDKTNVWLDTSFSLPYYIGSSIEQDYAFAYKNIGTDRIIFGSDIPYLNSEQAVDTHLEFFKRHAFSPEDVENIMYKNALRLFNMVN